MAFHAEDISLSSFIFFSDKFPAIVGLLLLVLFMLMILLAAIFKVVLLCREIGRLQKCLQGLEKFMHCCARALFRMKPSPEDTDGSPETEFFDYVVPTCFILQVFFMVGLLSSYAAFTFLHVSFVKESNECDPNNPFLACFNASNKTERVNCSTIYSTFNGSMPDLQCYEFVFQLSEALSAAGGVLSWGGLTFTVVATLILGISKGKDGCKNKKRCFCTLCIQVFIFVTMLLVLFILPVIAIADGRRPSYSAITELIVLSLIAVITVCVPWPWFRVKETPKAPKDGGTEMMPLSQSNPNELPAGPEDDAHEENQESKTTTM